MIILEINNSWFEVVLLRHGSSARKWFRVEKVDAGEIAIDFGKFSAEITKFIDISIGQGINTRSVGAFGLGVAVALTAFSVVASADTIISFSLLWGAAIGPQ